jgi:hypothetical protein
MPENVDYIYPAQVRVRLCAVVFTVMKLRIIDEYLDSLSNYKLPKISAPWK